MPLSVSKLPNENPQRLVSRFTKKLQQSGILLEARKCQFRERVKNRRARKISALRRQEMKEKYAQLEKLGKQ